jgi:hypothetical protein
MSEQGKDHVPFQTYEQRVPYGEHLAWCKERALQYVDAGDLDNAFASMGSDLNKHEGTRGHGGMQLGIMMLMAGQLGTPQAMREFIEGFH